MTRLTDGFVIGDVGRDRPTVGFVRDHFSVLREVLPASTRRVGEWSIRGLRRGAKQIVMLRRGKATHFLKIALGDSSQWLERESRGWTAARSMARAFERFLLPDLLYVDLERRFLLVSSIGGHSMRRRYYSLALVDMACRGKSIRRIFSTLGEALALVHRSQVLDTTSVSRRSILFSLRHRATKVDSSRWRRVADNAVDQAGRIATPDVFVHGDVGIDNIYAGKRFQVGLIDYEHSGLGSAEDELSRVNQYLCCLSLTLPIWRSSVRNAVSGLVEGYRRFRTLDSEALAVYLHAHLMHYYQVRYLLRLYPARMAGTSVSRKGLERLLEGGPGASADWLSMQVMNEPVAR